MVQLRVHSTLCVDVTNRVTDACGRRSRAQREAVHGVVSVAGQGVHVAARGQRGHRVCAWLGIVIIMNVYQLHNATMFKDGCGMRLLVVHSTRKYVQEAAPRTRVGVSAPFSHFTIGRARHSCAKPGSVTSRCDATRRT